MAVADNYTGAAGAVIYGGMGNPVPAWLQGAVLNKAALIPGSSGYAGAPMHVWGSFAVDHAGGRLLSCANGGHSDSSDNRCVEFNYRADSPAWEQLKATSLVPTPDVSHYPDGTPVSRHQYDFQHWIPSVNRVLMLGVRGAYINAWTFSKGDGFNPDAEPPAWDAPDTWPATDAYGYSCVVDTLRDHIWTSGMRRYEPLLKAYTKTITSIGIKVRMTVCYDTLRDQFFSLQWGDGVGANEELGVQACKWSPTGTTQEAVTFNASAAYDQFLSEKFASGAALSAYHGMCYDSANDCFYWYNGRLTQAGNLYRVTPNAGSAWDMSLFEFDVSSPVLPSAPSSGVNGRLKYIPALKGFMLDPNGSTGIYFVPTSV